MLTSLQNVPMSNNGAACSDIEEKLSNLSLEKPSYQSEMFRKERASFKLNKSSKGKKMKIFPPMPGVVRNIFCRTRQLRIISIQFSSDRKIAKRSEENAREEKVNRGGLSRLSG